MTLLAPIGAACLVAGTLLGFTMLHDKPMYGPQIVREWRGPTVIILISIGAGLVVAAP